MEKNMNSQFFQFPSNYELETIFEVPSVFETQPEAKAFLRFIQLVRDHRSVFRPEDSIKVRNGLKSNVPAPKSIDEFRTLYEKCYLNRKKSGKASYQKKNEKWKHEQVVLLVWVVNEYSHIQNTAIENLSEDDWKNIGSLFPDTNGIYCKYKWQTIQKSYSQKDEWTAEEDEKLLQLVNTHEKNLTKRRVFKWAKIANEINSLRKTKSTLRLGKHCRERWLNHLNPSITKVAWSQEEDLFLLEKVRDQGKRWAFIAKLMQGRTENSVKNRFISLSRILRNKGKKISPNNVDLMIEAYKRSFSELDLPEKRVKTESSAIQVQNLVTAAHNTNTEDTEQNMSLESGSLKKISLFEDVRRRDSKAEEIKNFRLLSPMKLSKNQQSKNLIELSLGVPETPTEFMKSRVETPNFKSLDPKQPKFFSRTLNNPVKPENQPDSSFHKPKLAILTNLHPAHIYPHDPSSFIQLESEKSLARSDDPFTNFDNLLNMMKMDISNSAQRKSELLISRTAADAKDDYLLHVINSPWLNENKKETTPIVKVNSPLKEKADLASPSHENKAYIFDIGNFILPNVYTKKYGESEEMELSSPADQKTDSERDKQLRLLVRENLDDISQRLSSLSLSDQLILEANKVLSISGMSPLTFSERFSEIRERSFFQNSGTGSHTDRSIIIVSNSGVSSKEEDQKSQKSRRRSRILIRMVNNNDIDSGSLLDPLPDHIIFTRNGQRCQTQVIRRDPAFSEIKDEEGSCNRSDTIEKAFEERKENIENGVGSMSNIPGRKGKKSTTVKLTTQIKDRSTPYEI